MGEHSSRIQLLACDMDGTLFRGDLVISIKVREAIAAAQGAGVTVVLATGRMPVAAKAFVTMLGLRGPQIYSNGALVQTVDGEVLFHLPVDPVVAERVVANCSDQGMHVNAYVGDDVFVTRIGPEAEFTRKLNRINPVETPDLKSFVAKNAPTKLVIVRLPIVEAGLLARLQEEYRGQLLIFSSVPQYVEMVNPLVDKGRALRSLAEKLGIPMDAVAAIGDGDNDVTLLQAAGFPIAMGNGTSALKAVARVVVGTVEDDGVAEAIDRFVLR